MNFISELNIDLNKKQLITVTGSGGKTTLVEDMAEELVENGKTVLIATSTKIFYPGRESSITILNPEILKSIKFKKADIIYGGKEITVDNKIAGFDREVISEIFMNDNIDFILVEGDGSKKKPVKGYAYFEPVIPQETEILISVLGMNSLGLEVNDENVHRVEEFMESTGLKKGDTIECKDLFKLFVHSNGYFKVKAKINFIILNRVNEENLKCAEYIRERADKELDFVEKTVFMEEWQC